MKFVYKNVIISKISLEIEIMKQVLLRFRLMNRIKKKKRKSFVVFSYSKLN